MGLPHQKNFSENQLHMYTTIILKAYLSTQPVMCVNMIQLLQCSCCNPEESTQGHFEKAFENAWKVHLTCTFGTLLIHIVDALVANVKLL